MADLDDELIKRIDATREYGDPAFLSASLEEERALGYGGNVYTVIVGRSARYIAPLAFTPADEEVLFLPGTRFGVLEIREGAGPDGRLLIRLKEPSQ